MCRGFKGFAKVSNPFVRLNDSTGLMKFATFLATATLSCQGGRPTAHFASFNLLAGNGIFEIYRGSDGKLHIRWILPDPPPDLMAELRTVAVVVNEASQLKNKATAEKFQQFAEGLLNARAAELHAAVEQTTEVARAS